MPMVGLGVYNISEKETRKVVEDALSVGYSSIETGRCLSCTAPSGMPCREFAIIAGGVSANSGLREAMTELARRHRKNIFLPPLDLTTDNAAMVAVCGYFKYLRNEFVGYDVAPYSSDSAQKPGNKA